MWNALLAEGKIGQTLLNAWIAKESLRNLLAAPGQRGGQPGQDIGGGTALDLAEQPADAERVDEAGVPAVTTSPVNIAVQRVPEIRDPGASAPAAELGGGAPPHGREHLVRELDAARPGPRYRWLPYSRPGCQR
ncbi:hypothetical protein [Streptomyces sp. NBC_00258]|uniref:hypothetical protein n=1 Tax=Streptomyces sp. NBC_00258 TaxID=2903642 RepID=UPI002E2D9A27|nr:hypothetical protein [Streptomyces sp. NBC_00258]